MEKQDTSRASMLGALIQDARSHAGRSIEDCASVLAITPEAFRQAETGEYVVSLPQLEVLAIYLNVPMAYFWGTHALEEQERRDYRDLLALRHKIVGGLLRRARLEAGRSAEDLGEQIGVSAGEIDAYETGAAAIPYIHLEKLAGYLGISMDYFVDDERGPLGRHEAQQKLQQRLAELPSDVREFVIQPVNMHYLQTAMRLSKMDVQRLRDIAASILDITY
jgi:transcriptional regulator with XRE-family HTH domain